MGRRDRTRGSHAHCRRSWFPCSSDRYDAPIGTGPDLPASIAQTNNTMPQTLLSRLSYLGRTTVASAKSISYTFDTHLAVRDLALRFREALQKPGGLTGFIASKTFEWDFFTPEPSEDPFSALEQAEAPTFAVAASYGIRGLGKRPMITTLERFMESSTGGAVLLEVRDRGEHRSVLVRHVGDLSPASRKCVRNVLDSYVAADPGIRVRQEKGRVRR